MNTLYEEELKKVDFTNLHETIFTIGPDESVADDTSYLNANKIGHLVPEAPKLENLDDLSLKFYKLVRRSNRNKLRYGNAPTGLHRRSKITYSYEDSQRKLTSEQTTYQAIDRTVVFNQLTTNVLEAATTSLPPINFTSTNTSTTNLVSTSSGRSRVVDHEVIFDKINELANKKVKTFREQEQTDKADLKNEVIITDPVEDLNQGLRPSINLSKETNQVEVNLNIPYNLMSALLAWQKDSNQQQTPNEKAGSKISKTSVISSKQAAKNDQEAQKKMISEMEDALNRAIEDFKASILGKPTSTEQRPFGKGFKNRSPSNRRPLRIKVLTL